MAHLVHAIGHVKVNTTVMDAVVREATEIIGLRITYSDDRQTWLSSNGRAAGTCRPEIGRELRTHHWTGSADSGRRARGRLQGRRRRVPDICRASRVSTAWRRASLSRRRRACVSKSIRLFATELYGRRYSTLGSLRTGSITSICSPRIPPRRSVSLNSSAA